MQQVKVKEKSLLALIAAKLLRQKRVALVIGSTIFLHNTSKTAFMAHKRWLLHELKHVEQYQTYGILRFLLSYLYESAKNGYLNNKFEVAARAAENQTSLLNNLINTQY